MKTDLIEIFQTIRASLQPYATLGFDNRTNSETLYDLWSNKNVKINGTSRNEVFFASVEIDNDHVSLYLLLEDQHEEFRNISDSILATLSSNHGSFEIKELDESLLSGIEDAVATAFKIYKDNGWVI
jgi:hypothetical protein